MKVASSTSPACSASPSLSTVSVPSAAVCTMVAVVAAGSVTDRSLWRKSPADMVATCDFESPGQSFIMREGCLRT